MHSEVDEKRSISFARRMTLQRYRKMIFVEEFLDFKGKSPNDYKVFCFNGDPKYIQVDYDRFDQHKRNI